MHIYCYHVGRVSPYLQKMSSLINIRPRNATPCIPTHDNRFFLVLECFKHHRSMKNSQHTKSLGDRNLPPWILHAASSKWLLVRPPFSFRDRRAIVTLRGLTGGATVPSLIASMSQHSDEKSWTLVASIHWTSVNGQMKPPFKVEGCTIVFLIRGTHSFAWAKINK